MTYEKELKLLLSKDDYSLFLKTFQEVTTPVNQVNYYFDTPELSLNQFGITLRVREENREKLLLCLKMKLDNLLSDVTISSEYEKSISVIDFKNFKNNPEVIYTYFDNELPLPIKERLHQGELKLLGSINNHRRKLLFQNNFICDLDYTVYPNGDEFYEMEFEGIECGSDSNEILEILNSIGISYSINKKSKYKRFVESIACL